MNQYYILIIKEDIIYESVIALLVKMKIELASHL